MQKCEKWQLIKSLNNKRKHRNVERSIPRAIPGISGNKQWPTWIKERTDIRAIIEVAEQEKQWESAEHIAKKRR